MSEPEHSAPDCVKLERRPLLRDGWCMSGDHPCGQDSDQPQHILPPDILLPTCCFRKTCPEIQMSCMCFRREQLSQLSQILSWPQDLRDCPCKEPVSSRVQLLCGTFAFLINLNNSHPLRSAGSGNIIRQSNRYKNGTITINCQNYQPTIRRHLLFETAIINT